ncbi:hypothetical protein Tco_0429278 [Tanacetum coccineum]
MSSYNRRGCFKCGGPFGGLYWRQCTCERCRRNYTDEVCALCCYEVEKSFVNDSNPNSFIDSPNIFNPPPQPQTYSCVFCGNNAHYGYDCPPQVPFIYNPEPCYNQDIDNDFPQSFQSYPQQYLCCENCGDDDEEYTIAITPVLPTVEPDNSLSMGDEHLNTIPEKKESSVEDLVPIPSESEGIFDGMCDVPFCENSYPFDALKDHYEIFFDPNDDYASSDDDPLYSEDIDYVDASPPDSELVSLEEVKDFDTEDIEALKDNPTPSTDSVLKSPFSFPNSFLEETDTSDNSLPEFEIFCFDMEEKNSGNPTSHSDLSLPDYEAFYYDNELDSENFTIDVVEDIFDNPTRELYVHVPNVFPTHPTLYLDSDFAPSDDSFGSDLVVSFPSGTRNKIFDPGIFIEVQSKRFLSPNELSISFIRDPLSPVFDTLLPFSSENEEKVFNPGSLSSNEEKSPHLLSHRGFNPSKIISESPMMISGGDIPILDVPIAPDYEASRARGFVLRSLELQSLA